MPDLVYRMRIELPDSETQSIKQQLQELESLKRQSASPSSGGGNTTQQTNQLKQYTDAIRRNNSELKKARASFRELQRLKGLDSKATQKSAEQLEYLSAEVLDNNEALARQARALNLSEREHLQLNNALTAGTNAFITADKSLENYNLNLQMMGNQAGKNNKVFSGANQALFSFSDLVQDSTQFSQGFAQGMRAIGNNVGFTAELLINMNKNAKASGETFKSALMGSFRGAAGALVLLNIAMTAGTILLDKLGKKGKEVSEAIDLISDSASSLRDEGSFDFLGINDLQTQVEFLGQYEGAINRIEEARKQLRIAAFGAGSVTLMDARQSLQLLTQELGITEEQAELLAKRLKESKDELLELKAIAALDPLGNFKESVSEMTEGVLSDAKRGFSELDGEIKALTSEQTQRGLQRAAGLLNQMLIEAQAGDFSQLRNLNVSVKDTGSAIDFIISELGKLEKFVPKIPTVDVIPPKDVVLDGISDIEQTLVSELALLNLKDELGFPDKEFYKMQKDLFVMNSKAFTSIANEEAKKQEASFKDSILRRLNLLYFEQREQQRIARENAMFLANMERIQTNLVSQEAQARLNIQRNVQNAIASLAQVFERDNKALALSLLAIEKGLAIAQVVVEGIKQSSKATAQGLFYAQLPFGVGAAQAAASFKAASAIKASTAASVAAIVAQGLAQGATTIRQGAFSGSAASAGLTGGSSAQQQQFANQSNRSVSEIEPRFVPRNQQDTDRPVFIIENRITDKQFATLVKSGNNKILSQAKAI